MQLAQQGCNLGQMRASAARDVFPRASSRLAGVVQTCNALRTLPAAAIPAVSRRSRRAVSVVASAYSDPAFNVLTSSDKAVIKVGRRLRLN